MHSRHPRKGGRWWILLSLASLWLISSAAGAASQTMVNTETMTPAGTGAQSPPRAQEVAAVETYQGILPNICGSKQHYTVHIIFKPWKIRDITGNIGSDSDGPKRQLIPWKKIAGK